MTFNFVFFTIIVERKKDSEQVQYEEKLYQEIEEKRNEVLSTFYF